MQVKTLTFTYRKKEISGEVVFPENLQEALSALGQVETFECFLEGYTERQMKRLRMKPKRYLKLDLSILDEETVLKLKEMKLV